MSEAMVPFGHEDTHKNKIAHAGRLLLGIAEAVQKECRLTHDEMMEILVDVSDEFDQFHREEAATAPPSEGAR